MWCPRCRSEYVSGVTSCADCGVDLIGFKPPDESSGIRLEPQVSFIEPSRAREDRDSFVCVWEGGALPGEAVRRALLASQVPMQTYERDADLDASGRAWLRIDVPIAYVQEAGAIIDEAMTAYAEGREFAAPHDPPAEPAGVDDDTVVEESGRERRWRERYGGSDDGEWEEIDAGPARIPAVSVALLVVAVLVVAALLATT